MCLALGSADSLAANELGRSIRPPGLPQRGICAHRGASDTHPENTLASLKEAVRLGAHMVEFDVALSKDRALVLMHDETVDRTTDGSGRVSDLTLADLGRLDAGSWKGMAFQNERIPTLQQALDVMPINMWLNIHLKGSEALATNAARCVVKAGRLPQSFLACDLAAAAAARRVDPRIMICNMERTRTSQEYIESTMNQGSQFIQLWGRRPIAWHRIGDLQQRGVFVNYCCSNEANELRHLWDAGVDFPLVDRVAQMILVAEDVGIKRLEPIYAQDQQE